MRREKYLGLIAAINDVLEGWPEDKTNVGAIETLQALGYTVGLIFSSPNLASREYGRLLFLQAIETGAGGTARQGESELTCVELSTTWPARAGLFYFLVEFDLK